MGKMVTKQLSLALRPSTLWSFIADTYGMREYQRAGRQCNYSCEYTSIGGCLESRRRRIL